MAFSSFGLPAPGLAAPGLAPQLNLNGGQQGQGLILAAARGGGGEESRLGLGDPRLYALSPSNISFAKKWADFYHSRTTPESVYSRLLSHQRGERKPKKDAFGNMDAAVAVFGPGVDKGGNATLGDKIIAPGIKEGERWTGEEIKEILTRIGAVETGFNPEQKKQLEGGTARSYWQVKPQTALNLLNDESKVLFGKKFEDRFRDKYGDKASEAGYKGDNAVRDWLASFKYEKMSELLFEDGDLAATLAMGKWISGLQNQVNENLAKAKQGSDI